MPKIDIAAKVWLPVPDQQFGGFSQEVVFRDIDVEEPLESQIEMCAAALDPVTKAVHEGLAQQTANLGGVAVEGVGLGREFREFQSKVTGVLNKIVVEVRAHKGELDKVDFDALAKQFGANVTKVEAKSKSKAKE